jgi:hypothetical protein
VRRENTERASEHIKQVNKRRVEKEKGMEEVRWKNKKVI